MPTVRQVIAELNKFPLDDDIHSIVENNKSIRQLFIRRRPHKDRQTTQQLNQTLALVQKLGCVLLPRHVEHCLQECLMNGDLFWKAANQKAYVPRGGGAEVFNSLFKMTVELEQEQDWSTVRLRFLLVFFADLKKLLQIHRLGDSNVSHISAVLRSSGLTYGDIGKNFANWSNGGARYRALADYFGIGVLFFLPLSISRNRWEHTLPSSGPQFDLVVKHLTKIGIARNRLFKEANDLGSSVMRAMIDPFQIGSAIDPSQTTHSEYDPTLTTSEDWISVDNSMMQAVGLEQCYQPTELLPMNWELVYGESSTLTSNCWIA